MICPKPKCGGTSQRVLKTENYDRFIMRLRICLDCGHRFHTTEKLVPMEPVVISSKKNLEASHVRA
jgi:transcriptional regulator NrdR family protein